MRVLVLGGTGFIGRHVVEALRRRGHTAVIATRSPRAADRRLPPQLRALQRCEVHLEQMLNASDWRAVLAGHETIVNCVGILRPRWRETYEKIHHLALAALAEACSVMPMKRLVHVSALGLEATSASGFMRSKLRGELALAHRRMDAVIVRPSLLDGAGGFGARWLRRLARWPVHFVPANATGRLAPLHVEDLGEAIAMLCEAPPLAEVRRLELGGPDTVCLADYLGALRRETHARAARIVRVPALLARLLSHACDLLHLTPFSFGHLLLLQRDNVPAHNGLAELLGRAPRRVGAPHEYAFRPWPNPEASLRERHAAARVPGSDAIRPVPCSETPPRW